MIKAEAEKGVLKLDASGTFPELMAEFTCIASVFFEKINPEIPFEKKVASFVTALTFGEKAKQGGHFYGR